MSIRITATDRRVSWMGRVVLGENEVTSAFPGVTAILQLIPQTVAVDLTFQVLTSSETCWLWVATPSSHTHIHLEKGQNTVRFSVPAGEGAIRITRATDAWHGSVTFQTFELSAGAFVETELPTRKLMFVGDSITCGGGTFILPPRNATDDSGDNARFSFGSILGRILNAQVHLVSYGGRGLVRDWQGLDSCQTNNAPIFFERALPDSPEPLWDHDSYQPDAIVVGLGTNDFNVGIPDQTAWTTAYSDFLARIRRAHPASRILLMNSPMHGVSPAHGALARRESLIYYLEVVKLMRFSEGDLNVQTVTVDHQAGTQADSHPTFDQHEKIALQLLPFLHDSV